MIWKLTMFSGSSSNYKGSRERIEELLFQCHERLDETKQILGNGKKVRGKQPLRFDGIPKPTGKFSEDLEVFCDRETLRFWSICTQSNGGKGFCQRRFVF
jgi:hypothetical protein